MYNIRPIITTSWPKYESHWLCGRFCGILFPLQIITECFAVIVNTSDHIMHLSRRPNFLQFQSFGDRLCFSGFWVIFNSRNLFIKDPVLKHSSSLGKTDVRFSGTCFNHFVTAQYTSSSFSTWMGLPGVLGNKGTWLFTFREQGIS